MAPLIEVEKVISRSIKTVTYLPKLGSKRKILMRYLINVRYDVKVGKGSQPGERLYPYLGNNFAASNLLVMPNSEKNHRMFTK